MTDRLTGAPRVVAWIAQLAVAAILAQTLFFKFTAAPESVWIFETLGLEPWGRIGSGVAELAAVVLLLWPNIGKTTDAPLGAALGLIAGFAWAIGTLIVKRVTWGAPGLTVTAWQVALCWFPITLGTAFFSDWSFTPPSTTTLVLVVYIALVPMAIGTACWFAIVNLLPANVAALSSIAVPVVAMLSGALVNREPLGPLQVGALACAVAAIWLVLRPPARKAEHKAGA